MTDSKEVVTHPDLERRTRRQFGGAEKQRLLAEAEALPHGDKGAWPSISASTTCRCIGSISGWPPVVLS